MILSFCLLLFSPQLQDLSHPFAAHQTLEVRANTFTSNRQMDPSLAAGPEGEIFAVWGSRRQEQGTFGIFAQLLDPLGRPIGTEIHVNQYLPEHQIKPSVAFGPDGNAWVVWNSIGQDGDRGGIFARRFGWQTAEEKKIFGPLGDEFPVASNPSGDQGQASVHIHPGGNVLVTWTDAEELQRTAMGRCFTASGAAVGDEFQIGQNTNGGDWLPTATAIESGWVVAWAQTPSMSQKLAIQGRLVSLEGTLSPKILELNPQDGAMHMEPSLSSNGNDRFVLAWMSVTKGSDYQVRVRTFDSQGTPRTKAQVVDAGGTGYRNGATVVMHSDGRFVVAYNDNNPNLGQVSAHRPSRPVNIRAQAFSPTGALLGSAFQVNQATQGEQNLQVGLVGNRAIWTDLGQLAFIWHGNVLNDKRAAGITIFADSALNPAAPEPVVAKAAAADLTVLAVYADSDKPYYDPFFIPDPKTPAPPPRGSTFGFEAIANTGWYPPDPDLAVGADYIVGVVNGEIAVFEKDGTKTFNRSLTGFWSNQGAGGFVFDPIALYDSHTERFIVAAADGAGSNDAICIAVSKTTDPNGGWHKYRFAVSSTCTFLDFPNMGVDRDTIYVTGDCFNGGGNRIFMFDKAAMVAGQSVNMKQTQTSSSVSSLGASKNYDTNTSVGYFASTWAASTNKKMMLRAVTDANSSPQLFSYEVDLPQQYNQPPGADQYGTSNRASTIDYRVKNGVVRNGSLWICHNSGHANTARTRWYEFALNGWPLSGNDPTLAQYGTLNFGVGEHNWFGDIHVDANNNAVIAFNRSSVNQYISVEYVYRNANDPAGEFGDPIQLQISTSPETGSRWGDYSGVDEDPANPGNFWSHHEYRTSSWRTWMGYLGPSYEIEVSLSTLVGGMQARIDMVGAQPGERIHAIGALTPGSICPPQLGGLCLGLGSGARLLGSRTADSAGNAFVLFHIPAGLTGSTAYVQAAVVRGPGGVDSVASNVASDLIY